MYIGYKIIYLNIYLFLFAGVVFVPFENIAHSWRHSKRIYRPTTVWLVTLKILMTPLMSWINKIRLKKQITKKTRFIWFNVEINVVEDWRDCGTIYRDGKILNHLLKSSWILNFESVIQDLNLRAVGSSATSLRFF